jgi:cytochrome c-type protein NapB
MAPANPHLRTEGLSAFSRCQQCHVFRKTEELFAETTFQGLAQRPRRGERMYAHAPPTIPHHVFMREDCNACHSGPAARKEIECSHPERTRCLQCHGRTSSLR